MAVEVEARDERQAYEYAQRLQGLLASPLVKMAVEGEGIRLANDGKPTVFQPQQVW